MSLQISKIKPNPAGKDRQHSNTPASQLAAEWGDVKNVGAAPITMDGIDLYHLAYAPGSTQGKWDKVTSFTGTLPAGFTLRVHSGYGPDNVIRPEDRAGAEYHALTNRDYVWNNRQGDTPMLYSPSLERSVDKASYEPFPPEGQVLVRAGAKLVPAAVPAYAG